MKRSILLTFLLFSFSVFSEDETVVPHCGQGTNELTGAASSILNITDQACHDRRVQENLKKNLVSRVLTKYGQEMKKFSTLVFEGLVAHEIQKNYSRSRRNYLTQQEYDDLKSSFRCNMNKMIKGRFSCLGVSGQRELDGHGSHGSPGSEECEIPSDTNVSGTGDIAEDSSLIPYLSAVADDKIRFMTSSDGGRRAFEGKLAEHGLALENDSGSDIRIRRNGVNGPGGILTGPEKWNLLRDMGYEMSVDQMVQNPGSEINSTTWPGKNEIFSFHDDGKIFLNNGNWGWMRRRNTQGLDDESNLGNWFNRYRTNSLTGVSSSMTFMTQSVLAQVWAGQGNSEYLMDQIRAGRSQDQVMAQAFERGQFDSSMMPATNISEITTGIATATQLIAEKGMDALSDPGRQSVKQSLNASFGGLNKLCKMHMKSIEDLVADDAVIDVKNPSLNCDSNPIYRDVSSPCQNAGAPTVSRGEDPLFESLLVNLGSTDNLGEDLLCPLQLVDVSEEAKGGLRLLGVEVSDEGTIRPADMNKAMEKMVNFSLLYSAAVATCDIQAGIQGKNNDRSWIDECIEDHIPEDEFGQLMNENSPESRVYAGLLKQACEEGKQFGMNQNLDCDIFSEAVMNVMRSGQLDPILMTGEILDANATNSDPNTLWNALRNIPSSGRNGPLVASGGTSVDMVNAFRSQGSQLERPAGASQLSGTAETISNSSVSSLPEPGLVRVETQREKYNNDQQAFQAIMGSTNAGYQDMQDFRKRMDINYRSNGENKNIVDEFDRLVTKRARIDAQEEMIVEAAAQEDIDQGQLSSQLAELRAERERLREEINGFRDEISNLRRKDLLSREEKSELNRREERELATNRREAAAALAQNISTRPSSRDTAPIQVSPAIVASTPQGGISAVGSLSSPSDILIRDSVTIPSGSISLDSNVIDSISSDISSTGFAILSTSDGAGKTLLDSLGADLLLGKLVIGSCEIEKVESAGSPDLRLSGDCSNLGNLDSSSSLEAKRFRELSDVSVPEQAAAVEAGEVYVSGLAALETALSTAVQEDE